MPEPSEPGETPLTAQQQPAASAPAFAMSVWARIKKHKVAQWTLAYAAAAYTVLHATEMVSNAFEWPHFLVRIVTLLLILGLPLVVTIAWYHGHRAQRRASGVELTIITVLLVVAGTALWQFGRPAREHAAHELGTTAPAPSSADAIAGDHSVPVLPFVNMSTDKEQEFFADGISEELLNLLAQVPDLRVIARTSSFSFKGKDVEIAEIARRLHVGHVLEGSVRKSGDKVRISTQLIRASDSSQLWSQTYDRQMTDVFELQEQIAAAVVSELKMKLLGAAPKARIADPKAYMLFLQAREIGRRFTTDDFEESNKLYRQALELDPRYAAAWAGLASNYWNQAFSGLSQIDETIRLAREATNKALALDATLASALVQLSVIASTYDADLSMGAHHLRAALASEPTNPDVVAEAGLLVRRLGRLDEAIAIGKYQVGLDPINPYGHEILAYSYRYAGRLDDAIAALRTVLSLSPNYIAAHEGIGELLLDKGDAKSALAEMQQEVLHSLRLVGVAMAHHALDQKPESDAALAELIKSYAQGYSLNIAYVFAFRGEADPAFEWLEKAAREHNLYFYAVAGHPMFANIHSDPRWVPFLRKHGMAPEQLAAIKFDVTVPK